MKIIDIATENHVSAEDIVTICKDLGIQCDIPDADLSEKDVFLIKKKIEVIKDQRAKAARKLIEKRNEKADHKGAKIKLKRKVHASKELIKEKAEEEMTMNGETSQTAKARMRIWKAPQKRRSLRSPAAASRLGVFIGPT